MKTGIPGSTRRSPALPFAFIRRPSDYSRSVAAVFSLSPGETLFGCGESFTRLDKRGQKVVLWANDANGVETGRMYKPIPFFMSSRGYGMFVHTSAPATFDFGASYGFSNALLLGDDELDLFVFLGEPKDILNEYTSLTGKAAMPPLWSFGLWMSRITYFPEDEVRGVAAKDGRGNLPYEDAVLDFTNPATVAWYREKTAGLLRMGVGAIEVDFGETDPLAGKAASTVRLYSQEVR
jgi:alpha-D-xyloside xylohydrolase